MYLATDVIYRTDSKSKRYSIQQDGHVSSYKAVMYIQKLHHFCNTSSPDDGPKLGRKYLENNLIIMEELSTNSSRIS